MINNEEAIEIVNLNTEGDDEVSMTARVFLCEDILQMGIDDWIITPLEDLLLDMVGYIKHSAKEGIDGAFLDAEDNIDKDSMKEFCFMLTDKMVSTYKSMVKYATVYQHIKDTNPYL